MKHVTDLIKTVLIEGTNLGYLSEAMAHRLTFTEPRMPIFYVLPKIHKLGFPPKGRPIISGNNSPLEPLSKFLDFYLQPFVLQSPSYIRDTKDFINKIEGMYIPPEALMVTLDVTTLYTSIPYDEAYKVIARTLKNGTDIPHTYFCWSCWN